MKKNQPLIDKHMLNVLRYFVHERQMIHLKKDFHKEKPPWTDDPHFRKYKYCNVRREYDRTTIWGINRICRSKMSFKNKILNLILFRLICRTETFEQTSFPYDWDNIDWKEIESNKFENGVIFTNVFQSAGVSGQIMNSLKIKKISYEACVRSVLKESRYAKDVMNAETAKDAYKILNNEFTGLGEFRAYQVWLDLTYCPEFRFNENDFVHLGNGSMNGLKLFFNDKKGLSFRQLIYWMKENSNKLFNGKLHPDKMFIDIPKDRREYTLCCIENIMCEFYKYARSEVLNLTKPKHRYKGGE